MKNSENQKIVLLVGKLWSIICEYNYIWSRWLNNSDFYLSLDNTIEFYILSNLYYLTDQIVPY